MKMGLPLSSIRYPCGSDDELVKKKLGLSSCFLRLLFTYTATSGRHFTEAEVHKRHPYKNVLSNNMFCENEICHSTFRRHLLEEIVMGGKLRFRERRVS